MRDLPNGVTSMDDRHAMTAGPLSAAVLAQGAELCSLVRGDGTELIWPAKPRWPSHGPLLFPVVGELADHRLTVDGQTYPMERHGFARRLRFDWVERTAESCTLAITDTADTRAHYPFAFRLEAAYTLRADALRVALTATNTGSVPLPCSMGFHPAFNWPLDGGRKEDYRIELSEEEGDTVGQLDEAGLVARRVPSPVLGRTLHLSEAVFAHDALVFDPLRSTSARYVGPGGHGVEVAWDNAGQLGIWSKPGDFVCIEPWHGVASPVGFRGAFRDKPGLMHVPPGGRGTLSMTIRPF